MANTKKLVIILIGISVSLICAVFGMIFVLVDAGESTVNTDFLFKYNNAVSIFQVNNTINKSEFSTIDTSVGFAIEKPEVTPAQENQCFAGWYVDEECTIEATFPVVVDWETKIYPKFVEGNIPAENYSFYNAGGGYYALIGNMQTSTLENVVIPDYYDDGEHGLFPVRRMANYFLQDNVNIKTLHVGNNIESINVNTVSGCTALEEVYLGNSIKELSTNAFNGDTSLSKINLPDALECLRLNSFANCPSLTEIYIPKNVTTIGEYIFRACSNLQTIVVDEGNEKYDSRNNCNAIIETETNILINGCQNTVIPEGIVRINQGAFTGITTLTSIELPDTLESIGYSAFSGCNKLVSVSIPANVTIIETYAFAHCSVLSECVFEGNKLKTIENNGFGVCVKLNNIILPTSLETIEDKAFTNCYTFTSITIPASVKSIGVGAFAMCFAITELNVDSNNPIYDSRGNCNAIIETATNMIVMAAKTVQIPSSVVGFADESFNGIIYAGAKVDFTVPNNIKYVGQNTFRNCNALGNLIFASPSGWQKASDSEFTSDVSSVDLSDPAQNATWFRTTAGYNDYYWRQV